MTPSTPDPQVLVSRADLRVAVDAWYGAEIGDMMEAEGALVRLDDALSADAPPEQLAFSCSRCGGEITGSYTDKIGTGREHWPECPRPDCNQGDRTPPVTQSECHRLLAEIREGAENVRDGIDGPHTDCDGHTPYSILMALAREARELDTTKDTKP